MLFSRSTIVSYALLASSFLSVNAALEIASLEKRQASTVSGTLCGIGLLNNCGAPTPSVNTLNDRFNCGVPGNVCPADIANSAGDSVCVAGKCTVPCANGFSFNPSTGGCINTAFAADSTNCGSAGTVCNVANGNAQCVAGSCSAFTCQSGFTLVQNTCESTTLSNDALNCGAVGSACPLANGASSTQCVSGTCRIGGCSQGYVFALDTCNFIDVNTDPTNCGQIGTRCGSDSLCNTGVCSKVNCSVGSVYNPSSNVCQDVTRDPANCGAIGNTCATQTNSIAQCVNGGCVQQQCRTPFVVVGRVCALPASAAAGARSKRNKITKRKTLCPGEETACPIVGSASFVLAQSQGFTDFKSSDLSALSAAGGYECLDTKYSIESCGGCASMGDQDTGVNCLQLPHSSGVGCTAGLCVVFSCQAGYRPNLTGTGCVQATSSRARRSINAKRHVARSLAHSSH